MKARKHTPSAQRFLTTAALAVALSLSACGGGDSSSTAATYSTAGVLCTLSDEGNTVTNVAANSSLPFKFTWSCSSTQRTLVANGIPNHTVGSFPNANNPNTIATLNRPGN